MQEVNNHFGSLMLGRAKASSQFAVRREYFIITDLRAPGGYRISDAPVGVCGFAPGVKDCPGAEVPRCSLAPSSLNSCVIEIRSISDAR